MPYINTVETESIQAGTAGAPPTATAEFWTSLDPSVPFSVQNLGIANMVGMTNQIGSYNGVGVWNQTGAYNGIGWGVDVGGHMDAQSTLGSASPNIDFSSPSGNLWGYWQYNGFEISTEPDNTSDVNLKKDIESIHNSLDKVLNLNAVSFRWKEELVPTSLIKRENEIGLIAQEVEKIIPEVIGETLINGQSYKKISYGKLTTILIGAIQEQQKQIEELKETVAKLSPDCPRCQGLCYDV
jgi:hypothetical protein